MEHSEVSSTNGGGAERASAPRTGAFDDSTPAPVKLAAVRAPDAVRVGLCGLGRSGMGMVRREIVSTPQIAITCGFDLIAARIDDLTQLLGTAPAASFRQMLENPEIELIILATRSHEHVAMAIDVLASGKHVLVEKPVALSLRQTDRLLDAAKGARGQLFVRHNRRFDPPLLLAKQVIASGKLGTIFQVQLRQNSYGRRADWQTLRQFGGGQLLNWGPHVVDWALQLLGEPVVDVWSDLKRVAAGGDAEDHVKLMLRTQSGTVADIEISGAAAVSQPSWMILGSSGALRIEGANALARYYDPRQLNEIKVETGAPRDYASRNGEEIPWQEEKFTLSAPKEFPFWKCLYRTIRFGDAFPVTLEQVRQTMEVIEKARAGSVFPSAAE